MPELPPPLPSSFNQEPPQSIPALQVASTERRFRVAPLDDRANCLIGCAIVLIISAIGIYSMIQDALRLNQSANVILKQEFSMIALCILGSWMAVWIAMSRVRLWLRLVVFAAITLSIAAVIYMAEHEEGYAAMYAQVLLITVVLNTYFLLMSFFRFRFARAQKLAFENSTKNEFVLIPSQSTRAEIEAYADWHLYRKSPASGFMDAFRPMQFHLRQIFYASIYVGVLCIGVRLIVSMMFRSFPDEEFNSDIVMQILIQLICFLSPICFLLVASAMWVSLGKRRWLIRFSALLAITFVIIFIYKFFSTFGVTNLLVDFELTYDTIQPFVFAICIASIWMIVARCFGYRLIRLPLTINEKIGSANDPNTKSAF